MPVAPDRRWTIRPYRKGDEDGILALFNEVFAEYGPPFTERSKAHWNWQFRDNPLGHHTWVAEDRDGRIIGNYASIPGTWIHAGERFLGTQAVDTCVAREYRRSLKREGLFLSLAGAYFADCGRPEKDRIIYGFPNEAAYRVGTQILKYLPVHSPVRMLVRDFEDDWVDYLGPMGANAVEVRETRSVHADVGALFEERMADLPLVRQRDRAYMQWRFAACPSVRYRVLEARSWSGGLRGVLAMRTRWLDRPIAPLVDWVVDPTDREAVAGLAQRAAILARADGRRRLETWVPEWSALAATLREIGFAWDATTFNSCIRIFGPAFDAEWARGNWHYTMGDSDIY
jgi:hypothetical protein